MVIIDADKSLLLSAAEQAFSTPRTNTEIRTANKIRHKQTAEFFDLAGVLLDDYQDPLPQRPFLDRVTKPVDVYIGDRIVQVRVTEWKERSQNPSHIRAIQASDPSANKEVDLYSMERQSVRGIPDQQPDVFRVSNTFFRDPFGLVARNLEVTKGLQTLQELEDLLKQTYPS